MVPFMLLCAPRIREEHAVFLLSRRSIFRERIPANVRLTSGFRKTGVTETGRKTLTPVLTPSHSAVVSYMLHGTVLVARVDIEPSIGGFQYR